MRVCDTGVAAAHVVVARPQPRQLTRAVAWQHAGTLATAQRRGAPHTFTLLRVLRGVAHGNDAQQRQRDGSNDSEPHR
jgi:hypothetical protein